MHEWFFAQVLSVYHILISIIIVSLIALLVKSLFRFIKYKSFTISYSEEHVLSRNTGEELYVRYFRDGTEISEYMYNDEIEFEKIERETGDDDIIIKRKDLQEACSMAHLEGQKYILESYRNNAEQALNELENVDLNVELDIETSKIDE